MTLSHLLGSLLEVTLAGIVLGAGLPALFSLGIRLSYGKAYTADDGSYHHKPTTAGRIAGGLCFAITLGAIIAGILWVTSATIYQYFGLDIFGTQA